MLALVKLHSPAGITISQRKSAKNSCMVDAMETPTISTPKLLAKISVFRETEVSNQSCYKRVKQESF